MSTSAYVVVRDPHRPASLVAAACNIAGALPGDLRRRDDRDDTVYLAAGTRAFVSVHYPPGLGDAAATASVPLPAEDGAPEPPGYALVMFSVGGGAPERERPHQTGLALCLGEWLDASGFGWAWRNQDGPWLYPAA